MNKKKTRVPAEFAPETRFELRPIRSRRFARRRKTNSSGSKTAARAAIEPGRPASKFNVPLRRAANEAAALAWATVFPLLVFPALFEEMTEAAAPAG